MVTDFKGAAPPRANDLQPPRAVVLEPASELPARPEKRRTWLWFIMLISAGAGAYFAYPHVLPYAKPMVATLLGGPPAPAKKKAPEIPVVTAVARRGDMNLYLNGLGSVTAFNVVTVRCRVDGELMKVHFTEGQMVEQGQLLAEIDPRPFEVQLTQAQGQLTRDEAALKVAQRDLERYQTLRQSHTIPQQQVDAQIALVNQSKGAVQVDQGMIDNAKLQLTYAKITAPISGRIGLRMVDPGNIVRSTDLGGLAVITQLQPIALVFTISQDDVSRVQKHMNASEQDLSEKLVVEAWNRDFNSKLASGTLLAIDNQVDQQTGTVRLKAKFENTDNLLFPNQFVNARLHVETAREAVIVPLAAVQRGPESSFVYVVGDDSAVHLRDVVVGASEGDDAIIENGLLPGEIVVTDGLDKLQDKSKITIPGKNSGRKKKGKPAGDDQHEAPAPQRSAAQQDEPQPEASSTVGAKPEAAQPESAYQDSAKSDSEYKPSALDDAPATETGPAGKQKQAERSGAKGP